jgi:hypothetical protein
MNATFRGNVIEIGLLLALAVSPAQPESKSRFADNLSGSSGTTVTPSIGEVVGSNGSWSLIMPPSGRFDHASIYDPVRDRMVVFGGMDPFLGNDVWTLSLGAEPEWTKLAPVGTPPTPRSRHAAIYDPVRDRMIVFGGYDGANRIQTWALSLGAAPEWTNLSPGGTPPDYSPYSPTAIYDPVRDRMVVYLGDSDERNVWALSLGPNPQWSMLFFLGTSPGARRDATAVYDAAGDRMIVFGGFGTGWEFGDLNDVWAFSLAEGGLTWSKLAPSGAKPSGRSSHTSVYDPASNRMIVFGGYYDASESGLLNDVWELRLGASPEWVQLSPLGTKPSARRDHTAIYDPVGERVVAFGGWSGDCLSDVWALNSVGDPGWTDITPYGSSPSNRGDHTAIYDPVGDRMLINNGTRAGGSLVGSAVWALSLGAEAAWTQLAPSGTPPSPRLNHTAIYDAMRQRMVIFGGVGYGDQFTPPPIFGDARELTLGATPQWALLEPGGTPCPARASHTAIYDPVRDRMIVFGGANSSGSVLNDAWALSLGESPQWVQLAPSGTPPPARSGHTAIYDPLRDRMIVFGGAKSGGSVLNDAWALSLGESPQWVQLTPSGTPPSARHSHTAIYDRIGKRMVVFGGSGYRNDTWALALGEAPEWIQVAPDGTLPQRRQGHAGIYDATRDRMVIFGGYYYTGSYYYLGNPWALTWGRIGCATPDIVSCEPSVVDGENCAGGCTVTFTLNTQDDHSTVAKVVLERRLGLTWIPEDSIIAPSAPPPWSLHCDFDEHFGDGDHVFRATFCCMDGSSTVSEGVTVVANRGVPVLITGFHADYSQGGVLLRWWISEGRGLQGFNVYRSLRREGGFERVNAELVPADQGNEYTDRSATSGNTYWYRLGAVADDGEWMSQTVSIAVPKAALALHQNVPNPFNPTTTLSFVLPERGRAILAIYDIEGRHVRTLVDEVLDGGLNETTWDGRDAQGHRVSSGLYLYRLEVGSQRITRKMTILK